jgi:restriction system protein
MDKELEKLAPSKRSAAKTMFATFKILKEAGGQLPGKQVIDKIRETVELTEWEIVKNIIHQKIDLNESYMFND